MPLVVQEAIDETIDMIAPDVREEVGRKADEIVQYYRSTLQRQFRSPCVVASRCVARACLHACVHACARACLRASVRAFVRACVRACLPACLRARARACLRACVRA
jgi:hypothetical protein